MKTYIVLAFSTPGEEPKSAGDMTDWMEWMKKVGESVADMGSPFSHGVEGSGTEFSKITEDQWPAQGYMIVKADDMDGAVKLMASSPLGKSKMPLRIFEKVDMPEME